MMFYFGEELFDWVEIGRVFWQKDKFCPGGADGLAHGAGFMGAEIIHDDDITWREGWNQHFLDIDAKALAIDRAVEQPWRLAAVVAQGGQKRHGIPVAEGRLAQEPHSAWRPAPQRRHVGFCPGRQ